MASISFSLKSIKRFCSELLHSPIVGTTSSVGLIPQGIGELLILFFYLCVMAGLVLVLRRASTQPGDAAPLGACAGRGASEEADVLRPSERQTTAPPARRTMLAVFCGLLLGILCFSWGFVRLQVPGGGDGSLSLDHEIWLCPFSFFIYSTAGLLLGVFLLDSAKRHSEFGIRHGPLLVMLSCSALIHLLVPDNGGSVESGPAGFEFLLFLLFLCFMGGLMLVFLRTSANLGDIVSFNLQGGRADEKGAMLGSPELSADSAPPQSSLQPALMLLALSCGGLLHLLVSRAEDTSESTGADLELPVLFLLLSLMASLVMVFSRISA